MQHQNSVLHGLTKQIPWHVFDRLVEEHAADWRVRRLPTKSQLIALIFGQLSGASSLREVEACLDSHSARLHHLGARGVSRSTLADANAKRPHEVFTGLLAHMMGQAQRGLRRHMADAVRLIDSTGLKLSSLSAGWATAPAGPAGAKLHLVYDPDADRPVYAEVTAGTVNDITAAKAMPIEPGATYVFDLGYYDYRFWADLDAKGCRLVSRLKTSTPLQVVEKRTVAADSDILSDQVGFLPPRQARSRRNPFKDPVREIRVRITTGKILRLVSNDLDAPAEEIAELYRRRWQIELFFRWIKQTLKIKHFLGTSENAVRIQIAVALIAFLLLRLAQQATKFGKGPLAFARLVRVNIMHRRPLDDLLRPPPTPVRDKRQLSLELVPI